MIHEYINAYFPKPYVVFGNKLKSFSLGHLLILKSVNSPFVNESGQQAITYNDLLFAFVVLTNTFEENVELLNDPDKSIEEFTGLNESILNSIKDDGQCIQDAINMVKEYVCVNYSEPPMYVIEHNGSEARDSGTPWLQTYINLLTSQVGYSRSEALNMPINLAIRDVLWHVERQGNIRILSEEEVSLVKEAEGKR